MTLNAKLLANAFDTIAHPAFVKDRAGRYVLVNRAFCAIARWRPEEVVGKTDAELLDPEKAAEFVASDRRLFETRAPIEMHEQSFTDRNGTRYVLSTTKMPLFDDDGEVTHVVGISHDITRRVEADEALRRANDELEHRVASRTRELAEANEDLMRKERLAVLGQLAGGVAHQIRNPLAAIKNAAYVIDRLLKGRIEDDRMRSALADALAVVHDEVDGANQTITALLDYARVRHADRRPNDIADLVEAAVAAVAVPQAVSIVRKLPPLPMVKADADQIKSAIANLLQNAIEAMPDGGTVTFGAEREERAIVLTITDSGPGVAPAIRARLFEPLVTTKPLGLGLGLVTARTLLVGQGGDLAYEELGGGARFRLRLPIANLT
ncbi:MAG TPA: PAS domain-containing protein [Labilithrix sp.]